MNGVAPARQLSQTALPRLIPADASGYTLNSTATLIEFIQETILRIEDRLTTSSLRADLRDDVARVQELEWLTSTYYSHFGPLRQLLFERAEEMFLPGAGVLLTSQGTVRSINLAFEVMEEPVRLSGTALPLFECALIGRPKDNDIGEVFLREFAQLFANGVAGAVGANFPEHVGGEAAQVLHEIDLELGVRTRAISGKWLERLGHEKGVQFQLESDLLPHCFFIDDYLVISTSPKLSRRMLAAYRGQAPAIPGFEDSATRPLVARAHYTGSLVSDSLQVISAWVGLLASANEANLPEDQRIATRTAREMQMVAEAMKCLDLVRTESADTTDTRQTTTEIRLADQPR